MWGLIMLAIVHAFVPPSSRPRRNLIVRRHLNPGEVLTRGRTAAFEGRAEDALRDFIWVFTSMHSNMIVPTTACAYRLHSVTGPILRRRFYRPDVSQMASGEETLLAGGGDRCIFHDVASINQNLDRVRDTYGLFRRLLKVQPELARKCRDLAVEAIVEAKDFKLASKQLPHPEEFLLWLSERLNDDLTRKHVSRETADRRREAYVHNYCQDVRTAMTILSGLGTSRPRRQRANGQLHL